MISKELEEEYSLFKKPFEQGIAKLKKRINAILKRLDDIHTLACLKSVVRRIEKYLKNILLMKNTIGMAGSFYHTLDYLNEDIGCNDFNSFMNKYNRVNLTKEEQEKHDKIMGLVIFSLAYWIQRNKDQVSDYREYIYSKIVIE